MSDDLAPHIDLTTDAVKADLAALDSLPKDNVHAGIVLENGDVGAVIAGEKELGKGVFVEGDASWFKRAGWKAAAMIGWKK